MLAATAITAGDASTLRLYFKKHNLSHLLHEKTKLSILSGEEKGLSPLQCFISEKIRPGPPLNRLLPLEVLAVAGVVLLFWYVLMFLDCSSMAHFVSPFGSVQL